MTRLTAGAVLAVPATAVLVVIGLLSTIGAPAASGSEPVDVVVSALDPPPGGDDEGGPRGVVEVAAVDPASFAFAGWADFPRGASFFLKTTGGSGEDDRIRARSVPRPDVAEALDDPSVLYAGYSFSGAVETWGSPLCLFLVHDQGARPLWAAAPADCS